MSEIYGQANRYGKDIRDMSDFKSGIDSDLSMGENESTPAAHDDSLFPITLDWWIDVLGPNPIATGSGWLAYYQCGALLNSGRLNVKTRGDVRYLCRCLGVELK